MPTYFCKHCALKFTDLRALALGVCIYSPTKRHVVYDGHESKKFHCKCCGLTLRDPWVLALGVCNYSKTKKHRFYTGAEMEPYHCKYCGIAYKDMKTLVSGAFVHSPFLLVPPIVPFITG